MEINFVCLFALSPNAYRSSHRFIGSMQFRPDCTLLAYSLHNARERVRVSDRTHHVDGSSNSWPSVNVGRNSCLFVNAECLRYATATAIHCETFYISSHRPTKGQISTDDTYVSVIDWQELYRGQNDEKNSTVGVQTKIIRFCVVLKCLNYKTIWFNSVSWNTWLVYTLSLFSWVKVRMWSGGLNLWLQQYDWSFQLCLVFCCYQRRKLNIL